MKTAMWFFWFFVGVMMVITVAFKLLAVIALVIAMTIVFVVKGLMYVYKRSTSKGPSTFEGQCSRVNV
jgi:hypothetical protein